jgi:hypothetical protein
LTNEDVIDLYSRVKMGAIVVVLEPHHSEASASVGPKVALFGGSSGGLQ